MFLRSPEKICNHDTFDVMEPDRLFQSPFTDINAKGPIGVFPPAKVTKLVEVLDEIRKRAAA